MSSPPPAPTPTDPPAPAAPPPTREEQRAQLELDQLEQEVAKLKLELWAMRRWGWLDVGSRVFSTLTALAAIVSVWVGVVKYQADQENLKRTLGQQQETIERARNDANTQRAQELQREAAKPFWDAQLKLYLRASEAAAVVASSDEKDRAAAEREFWVLYYGPLAIVEDVSSPSSADDRRPAIAAAMVKFGTYLQKTPPAQRKRDEMEQLSLRLAHAMRDAAGPSFNLKPANLGETREVKPGGFFH